MRRELGDFQTPLDLVARVLECLGPIGMKWPRVLEPTCGRGNFIAELLELNPPPREIRGFEIQDSYLQEALRLADRASSACIVLQKANLFALDLSRDLKWTEGGPLLVLGNPPWVTNSELGALGSTNLPPKRNLRNLRGIDALTGESNFDIAEAIWLKLITELGHEEPTIALLCKTSVARNVLKHASESSLQITRAAMYRLDARECFGVSADACLFCVKVGSGEPRYEAAVFADLSATEPESSFGVVRGHLIADLETYPRLAFADGVCPLIWRQGLKHDAADVMELIQSPRGLMNRLGETVDVEPDYVYPLLKGSDVFHRGDARARLSVIVPQRCLGEPTRDLEQLAPKLWGYLTAHQSAFDRRKSSIYREQPPFAIFGIGPYSFAPYKVAISGLHKAPKFRAVRPIDGRPVMLDDTCYFVACSSAQQAAFVSALLNSRTCLDLVRSMVFWDSKRPITKKLLERIDLQALLERADRRELLSDADQVLARLLGTPIPSEAPWPANPHELLLDVSQESRQTSFAW